MKSVAPRTWFLLFSVAVRRSSLLTRMWEMSLTDSWRVTSCSGSESSGCTGRVGAWRLFGACVRELRLTASKMQKAKQKWEVTGRCTGTVIVVAGLCGPSVTVFHGPQRVLIFEIFPLKTVHDCTLFCLLLYCCLQWFMHVGLGHLLIWILKEKCWSNFTLKIHFTLH